MDPYSQQQNQGYSPQQYGQNPPQQPAAMNQYGQPGYSPYPYNGQQPQQNQQYPQASAAYQQPAAAQPVQQPQQQSTQAGYSVPSRPQVFQPQVFTPQGQPQLSYQNTQYQQQPDYNPYSQFVTNSFSSAKSGGFPFSLKSKAVIGVAGFIVLVGGIFGITKLSAETPNDLFLSALDNQMELSSMHVVYNTSDPKLNSTTKVNYYVDLAEPQAPKSAGTVENSFAFLRTKTEVAAEYVAQQQDVYVKFNNPASDNWILTTSSDQQTLAANKAANLSRVRGLALEANSVFGVVLSGEFDKELRTATIKAIKDRSAYSVVNSVPSEESGVPLRKYTIKPNRDVLREIQRSVADKLGAEFQDVVDSDKEYTIFIDTKRKYITKIEQVDGDTVFTVTYSEQNESFQASVPGNSITPDQYLSSFK